LSEAPGGRDRGAGGPGPRLPLLACAIGSLVLGVLAGLLRAGVAVPVATGEHVAAHALLMIGGFFGTVVSLERAVALGRGWATAAPLASALGAVALWVGAPAGWVAGLQLAAGAVLVAASVRLHRRQPQLHAQVLVVGAACWPAGTLAWIASGSVEAGIGLWISFLVVTIAGERLELSRFMPPAPAARRVFVGLLALVVIASPGWGFAGAPARVALGAGYLLLAGWLLRQDVARRTAREAGLTGFIGRALISGYAWLAIGALLTIAAALVPDPLRWDAALHALLLGFVMAMVFGHAPIIFPAVIRVRMPFHPGFYVPLALLHASLVLRVAGGLAGAPQWRAWGAVGNAIALATFLASVAASVWRGRRGRGRL